MAMAMVSARVPEEQLSRAQEVLKENGQTVSDLIRMAIEYTSEAGEVPDWSALSKEAARKERLARLDAALAYFEEENPFEGIGERGAKELLSEARDERYGL